MRSKEEREADSWREGNPLEYILKTLIHNGVTGEDKKIRLFDLYNGLSELRELKGEKHDE
jgi:hypothetical protein